MARDDRAAVERLNRYLDAAATGAPRPIAGLDPALVATVRRVEALDAVPAPNPAFLADLEERLMPAMPSVRETHQFATGLPTPRVLPDAPRGDRHVEHGRRRLRSPLGWAMAAVLAGVFIFSFGVLRPLVPGNSGHRSSLPAIAGLASPGAAACTVAPRPVAFFQRLLGTPAPAVPSPTPFAPDGGVSADPAVVAGVTATLQEYVTCTKQGDVLRLYALLTDQYLRQIVATQGPNTEKSVAALAHYTPTPFAAAAQLRVVAVQSVRRLPDGRVVAVATLILPSDAPANVAAATFDVVFARVGDRWLIDGFIPLAPTGTPAAATSQPALASPIASPTATGMATP